MTTAHVFGLLGVLVIIVVPAVLAGRVAARKGRPFWLYLIAGLLIGPLALIAALVCRGAGDSPSSAGPQPWDREDPPISELAWRSAPLEVNIALAATRGDVAAVASTGRVPHSPGADSSSRRLTR